MDRLLATASPFMEYIVIPTITGLALVAAIVLLQVFINPEGF